MHGRVAAELAAVVQVDDGGHGARDVLERDGPAVHKHDDGRSARGGHGEREIGLVAGQRKHAAVVPLALVPVVAGAGAGGHAEAERDDGHVRGARGRNGRREAGLVVAAGVRAAALRVVDHETVRRGARLQRREQAVVGHERVVAVVVAQEVR